MSKFICDGECKGCEHYHYSNSYCDYDDEDEESLSELEEREYYYNVLYPQIESLNRR